VRPARPADAPAIDGLLTELGAVRSDVRHAHVPPLAAALRQELAGGHGVVAEAGARLVGVAAWRAAGPERASVTLAVAEGFRLGDTAARLLACLGRDAAGHGARALVAEVAPANAALRAAARALGLREHRRGVHVEILLDALAPPREA